MKTFKTYEDYLAFLNNASENELQDIIRQANGEYFSDINIDLSFSIEWLIVKAVRHYQNVCKQDTIATVESFYNLIKNKLVEGITLEDLEDYGCYLVNYEENAIIAYETRLELIEELSDRNIYEDNFKEW